MYFSFQSNIPSWRSWAFTKENLPWQQMTSQKNTPQRFSLPAALSWFSRVALQEVESTRAAKASNGKKRDRYKYILQYRELFFSNRLNRTDLFKKLIRGFPENFFGTRQITWVYIKLIWRRKEKAVKVSITDWIVPSPNSYVKVLTPQYVTTFGNEAFKAWTKLKEVIKSLVWVPTQFDWCPYK